MALVGSVGATIGAATLLLLGPARVVPLIPWLVSFAAGTLLAGATLGLLVEALEHDEAVAVMASLLAGFVGFFALERLVIWRHGHEQGAGVDEAPAYLILVGDAIHNFMDGVAVGAAFAVDLPLGVATGLAVAAHEVPQEIGDFGILLSGGFPARKAVALNTASASTTLPGAVIAYWSSDAIEPVLGIVLAVAASSFIYIALVDLVPWLQHRRALSSLPVQFALILLGIGVVILIHQLSEA